MLPYSIVVYSAAAATLLYVALGFEVRLWGYSGETRALTIVGGAVVLDGLYFLLKGSSAAGDP